jgi:glucose-6-phosphate dehydrogenase assembly protein OpcA
VPGSIVEPLLITDLPTFCRWRGLPPWGRPELEQLVDVCDRLVVDSSEWRGLPTAYRQLEQLFDRIAASDIAWGRAVGWRGRLAALWPEIARMKVLSVTGPKADALLLAGWLRSRLRKQVKLTHRSAEQLERVAVDGEPVEPPRGDAADASDLLSAELDVFGRDRIYEAAVSAAR